MSGSLLKQFLRLCLLLPLPLFAATHNPQQFLDNIQGKENEGEQIVSQFCATCHAKEPLIALGAPKINDLSDWTFRVKQGLDTLFLHTEKGFGAMPARGGCFECTDKQLRLAIKAMIPKLLQKELK